MNWTKETMQELLNTNHAAVERALVVLFERQTRDEQAVQDTKHRNSIGFTAAHARRGTTYAKWILSGLSNGEKYGQCIKSPAHKDRARTMVLHYWAQLIDEAQKKATKA